MKRGFSDVAHVLAERLSDFGTALYPLLIFYVISIPVQLLLSVILGDGRENGLYALMQAIAAGAALPLLSRMYRRDRLVRSAHKTITKREKLERYLYAAVTLACISIAANNLLGLTGLAETSAGWEASRTAFFNGSFFLEFISLGIVIPYVEEFLYRGLIYERMRDFLSPGRAIFLTALLFGVLHFNLVQFLYSFFMGLFLAGFAERYRSFFPAFLGHAAANCIAVIRQEAHFSFEDSFLVLLVMTIVTAAAGFSLFGLQFKVARFDKVQ